VSLNSADPRNVVQREFDALASEYETNRLSGWYQAHALEILEHSAPLGGGGILDVGCGTGFLLRRLALRFPQADVVGLDISGEMIVRAKHAAEAEGLENIHFIKGDWEGLEEAARDALRRFDFGLIVCANAFHYFTDPLRAALDMFTILRPGGRLLVLEREKSNSPLTAVWGLLHRYFIKDQVKFYTTVRMLEMLKQAGFVKVDVIKTVTKYFWKRKLFTSIALIECQKSQNRHDRNQPNTY